ncbi:MAG: hypothetical protein LBV72_11050 [Tannerella sp.]|nr:hypothetical protein [Tannerella sp.]
MKSNNVNRIVLAWLLSVIFIIPYVAKGIHIYQNECCEELCSHCDGHHSHQHNCDTCPVCQFALSTFIEADFDKPDSGLTEFCSTLIYFLYNDKKYDSITHLDYLRAPPLS